MATATDTSKKLLTSDEAAEYLGIAPNTLAVWRSTRRHVIPYIKSGRYVRYRVADLEAYLAHNTVGADSTED